MRQRLGDNLDIPIDGQRVTRNVGVAIEETAGHLIARQGVRADDQAIRVIDCTPRGDFIAIDVGDRDDRAFICHSLQSIGIAFEVSGVGLVLCNKQGVWNLRGNDGSLPHPMNKMIALGGRGGELHRVVHRVYACTCGGTRLYRKAVDRQSDEIRANGEFRLALHRLAVAHIVFRQHKEAILNACSQRDLGSYTYWIDIIQLVSPSVLGTVEFELLNSAASCIVLTREGGDELVCAVGHHAQCTGWRKRIDGVQPGIGGDGIVDIEHDGGGGRNRVACDTLARFGLDGAGDEALTAVLRIVDGQEAKVNVCGRQARGGVYGLEYPEGLVMDDVQAGHHIQVDAERIPQIDAGLIARRRAFHGKDVTAKAEAAYPQGGIVELRMQRHIDGNLAGRSGGKVYIILKINSVGQRLRSRHPPQCVRTSCHIIAVQADDFVGISRCFRTYIFIGDFRTHILFPCVIH